MKLVSETLGQKGPAEIIGRILVAVCLVALFALWLSPVALLAFRFAGSDLRRFQFLHPDTDGTTPAGTSTAI